MNLKESTYLYEALEGCWPKIFTDKKLISSLLPHYRVVKVPVKMLQLKNNTITNR